MSDQRQEARASLRPRIQAEITLDGEVGAGSACEVTDLSRSGIRLAVRDPVTAGREVYIQLLLPEGPIALLGETAWVHPTGQSGFELGCWHTPDGPESRDRLEKLLEARRAGVGH